MSQAQITFQKFQSLLHTDEPASLGPEPRVTRDLLQILENKLSQAFFETKIPESLQPPIRSLILLWHDYLDESHSISQNLHGADGSFLHGIMHRREPDYGNAKYWFHRVGDHPAYPDVATRANAILDQANATSLKSKLVPGGKWEAFAFVDACEGTLAGKDTNAVSLLEKIQAVEFQALLQHLLR